MQTLNLQIKTESQIAFFHNCLGETKNKVDRKVSLSGLIFAWVYLRGRQICYFSRGHTFKNWKSSKFCAGHISQIVNLKRMSTVYVPHIQSIKVHEYVLS